MPTILIVDDTGSIRDVLAFAFKKEGYTVLLANDGKRGLDVALEKKPSLILADLIMPKLNGFEMIKEIRTSGQWGENVPIIVLTNLSPTNDVYKNIRGTKPLYYMIKKDWSLKELTAKVREVLSSV